MTKRERVLAALRREDVDFVPAGDLWCAPSLARALTGKACSDAYYDFDRDLEVRKLLNADLMVAGDWPSVSLGADERGWLHTVNVYGCESATNGHTNHIVKPMFEDPNEIFERPDADASVVKGDLVARFRRETDLFVFGQASGPVSQLDESLPFEDFLVWCMTEPEAMREAMRYVMRFELQRAEAFLKAGADGILITDDIAYNSGLFLPPRVMREMVYPVYEQMVAEIKAKYAVPVALHSDGQLGEALDDILACGFDALQSLQPSAGMDLGALKRGYGDKLCLWGNLDLDYLMTRGTPEQVRAAARRAIETASPGGGFILSTCNSLVDSIPPENARAMYEADRTPCR